MTKKRINALEVWKQFEDLLIPGLRLTPIERAVYSHLLRHSRLEGKTELRFSISSVARGASLSTSSARKGVRRLVAKGALRLAERSKKGHLVVVRLPEEIRALRARNAMGRRAKGPQQASQPEEMDFLETRELREAIHGRECGRCFYCLRRMKATTRCIDHVIPQARNGSNSYRNLASSCSECNAQKCEQRAEDFLRWLYREGRLGSSELRERLRAVERLAAGKLRPVVGSNEDGKGGKWAERKASERVPFKLWAEEKRRRATGRDVVSPNSRGRLGKRRRKVAELKNWSRGTPLRGRGTPALSCPPPQ